ncbi:phage major capsid protein [Lacticaseibacillus brantae]|uniref:Phage-related major head protein n=1 Tax=Lacticaseibacillus brantae DSM 23927 TaxID=1423727 RepID=A0A0R2B1U7_9LACO|nr:phage major capsid protein [Lacticaseibacillus brantae]KRM73013.1 phage-related major head protein [Lacticaseibacillus brantae DSM 23927]
MANPILINTRLKFKRDQISKNEEKLEELWSRQEEIVNAAESAEKEEDLDAVQAQADELDGQINELESTNESLADEATDLEAELEEANRSIQTKKEVRKSMIPVQTEDPKELQARSLIDYINTKGQKRDGIVTGDVAAIIPKEILYDATQEVKTTYDLTQFVNVRSVSVPGGTYNVAKKTDESLHTVEELAANPELSKPELITANWNVQTYRGQVTSSHESLRDAQDLNALLTDMLSQVVQNTKNRLIAGVLKTAPAKTVADTDGLKHIINVDLDPAYDKVIITSQSGFQFLDTLKDNEGRYLMQPDVTSPTGYRFLGMVVQPISDTLFGTQGDAVAFIGDAKRFDTLFDREELQIGWVTNENFATNLMAALSIDNKPVDTNAGFFVTFGAAPKA